MDLAVFGPLIAAALALAGAVVKAVERNVGAAVAYAAVALLAATAAVEKL